MLMWSDNSRECVFTGHWLWQGTLFTELLTITTWVCPQSSAGPPPAAASLGSWGLHHSGDLGEERSSTRKGDGGVSLMVFGWVFFCLFNSVYFGNSVWELGSKNYLSQLH